VAFIAIQFFLRDRIHLVFRVIEFRLRHPAIDQNRFGERGRGVAIRFHVMT
jgi:hypothetical protein